MKKQPAPLRPEKTCAARFDPFNSRLALKSSIRIQKYADCLTFIANLNLLLDKLNNLDPAPPLLTNHELPS